MSLDHAFFYKSVNGDRVYDDLSFEHWLKKFFTSGVFLNDLQVSANNDMTVNVSGGYVNIDGKVKIYENATPLIIETAGATYPRIDSIVLERNDTERDILLKVVKGGYSSEPVAHTPVRQDGVYQLVIAQVLVNAGAVKVTQANITDTRSDTELCGIVAGAVDQIDFSQVQAQFDDYFAQYKTQITTDFATWFEDIKNQLDEDAAGHLYNMINELEEDLDNAKSDGLSSMEQVQACTEPGKLVGAGAIQQLNDSLTSKSVDISITGTGATVDTTQLSKVGNIITGTIKVTFATKVTDDYIATVSGADKPNQEIFSYGYVNSSTVSRIAFKGTRFTFSTYGKAYESGYSVVFPVTWTV